MFKSKSKEQPQTPPPPLPQPHKAGEVRAVTRKDLPLSCPMPDAEVWDMHPRVYLPIEDDPNHEATCPYCGAKYRLEA